MISFPKPLAAAAGHAPLILVQRATAMMLSQILKRHPGLFSRLGEHLDKKYAFLPSDLPFAFVVEPARPTIRVLRTGEETGADAGVAGPLFMLLALMEGRQDADALFFSRDLTVTGDMEAMLALRNALDDSGIDLPSDLGAMTGPFAPLASRAANRLRSRILDEETTSWN